MPRPSPATASEYLAPSGRRILEMPGLHGGSASGHQVACLGVCPLPAGRGASWQVFEWSLEVCSRPQSLNSVPTAPIGPILARARVPVCVGRCDRGRRAMGQRRRPDGPCPCGGQRHHHRLWRPLHGPPRPPERGARRVPKIEPAHVGACVHASQPPRAPPTAAAVASALPQPKVHATHGLTRLVLAALAVVRATDVSPASRQYGRHRAPPERCSGRCGIRAPPQVRAGGRGRRQCVQGCGWRARSA